jgi:RNA-directed DNA polymerase
VVDADIKGAFDHISQDYLLQAIGPVPGRELIKQWLKAGYLEDGVYHPTPTGTGQGAVISPVLLNIALHGMEAALGIRWSSHGETRCNRTDRALIRYADDFVVLCRTREDAEATLDILRRWLAIRGLTLSEEKTRIVHLTEGFDFLGFHLRRYPTSRRKRGEILLAKPSRESVQAFRDRLREEWLSLRGHNVGTVVKRLNPIIKGWGNYFRVSTSGETFRDLDDWMFQREVRYAKRNHPKKGWAWQKQRYWGKLHPQRQDAWVFGDKESGAYLWKLRWMTVLRHTLIDGPASPDDPALTAYWEARARSKLRFLPPNRKKLAARQGGRCPVCGDHLMNGEELQVHHLTPRSRGGRDSYDNLALVHLYCHHQAHRGTA